MLPAWMVSSTFEAAGFAESTWAVPAKSVNWPRTVVTIACRALKPRRVWVGSMV